MDLGIGGRMAVVCASSRGLGKACALALAQEGCEILINGRNAETLAQTAQDIFSALAGCPARWWRICPPLPGVRHCWPRAR